MLEHMMFRGTPSVPDGEFDARMEDMGASCNAVTWLDYTAYTSTVAPRHVRDVLLLERDRMQNLALDPLVFQAEREVVANERRQVVEGDPDSLIHEELQRLAFGSGPYGWPTIGWAEDIADYTVQQLQAFYHRHYVAGRMCVILAGPIEPARAHALVSEIFGDLPGESLAPARTRPAFRAARSRKMTLDISAPRLCMAWPTAAAAAEDIAAWHVLADVLGGGDASRLPQRLEVEEALASDVFCGVGTHEFPHLLDLCVRALPGRSVQRIEEIVRAEIETLARTGPSEDELQRKRTRVEVEDAQTLMTTSGRADWMGSSWIVHDDCLQAFQWGERIADVTSEEVRTLAGRIAEHAPWRIVARPIVKRRASERTSHSRSAHA